MFTVVKNLIIQLFHVPAGELTNFLLICLLGVLVLHLIFK